IISPIALTRGVTRMGSTLPGNPCRRRNSRWKTSVGARSCLRRVHCLGRSEMGLFDKLFSRPAAPEASGSKAERTSARAPVEAPSVLRRGGEKIAAKTLDVSSGGARIEVARGALRTGERVRHLMQLPGDLDATVLEARVVWVSARGDVDEAGLAFTSVDEQSARRIDDLVTDR